MRVHQLPNPSRYDVAGTAGSVTIRSGVTMSLARVWWMFSINTIGVR
jgi:hypothetical protein